MEGVPAVSSTARRATVVVVVALALAFAAAIYASSLEIPAGAAQTGPFPPAPADNNPKCHEDSVENPDSEEWQTLFKYEGNPLATMANGETRTLSTNPLITVTRINKGTFDWTSSVSVLAVVVKASNAGNIYYYSPGATGGSGLITVGKHDISHIDWCGGTAGPTTTEPPASTTAPTTEPSESTSSTTSTPITLPPE